MFPKFLFHADHDAFVRTSQTEYPIRITTQEELDTLEPGWCEDPVEAAAFLTRPVETMHDAQVRQDAAIEALRQAELEALSKLREEQDAVIAAELALKEDAAFAELEKQVAAEDAALKSQSTQDVIARAMAASKTVVTEGDSK